jgi:hypothetical protein
MVPREQFLKKAAKIADILLIGGGAVSVLALLYIFYHYDWTEERQFASSMGRVLYYALPAGLASLLFASLILKPAYKVSFVIICLLLTASIYGMELFLHVSDAALSKPGKPLLAALEEGSKREKQQVAKLAGQLGVDIDTRDPAEVVTDLRKRGIAAVLQIVLPILKKQNDSGVKSAIHVHGIEIMPLGGISNKVTVVCNQNGEYLIYKTDEHGFHNPRGAWQSDHIDIAAVGNSFTLGYCVPSEKNFVALIRQRYPSTLNLGMAGEGPLHMLAVVKEYLPLFKPKIVLWFYFEGNNLRELQYEKQSPLLRRYLQNDFDQGLLERQNDIDLALMDHVENEMARKMTELPKRSPDRGYRLGEIIKLVFLRQQFGLVYGTDAQELDLEGATMDLFCEILSQAKKRISTWGGTLYFIYLPSWERYALNRPGVGGKLRTRVLAYVKSLGLPIIDLHPAFQAQSDPLSLFPFRETGHYNEKGHRLVAEEVLKAIFTGGSDDSGVRFSVAVPTQASPNRTGGE